MLNNIKDVCIVGLGTIGSSTGKYLKKYYNIIGIDINPQKVKMHQIYSPHMIDGLTPPPQMHT